MTTRGTVEPKIAAPDVGSSPREVEQQLALLETLFHNVPVGFALMDRDFRFVRVNEAIAVINGLPAAAHIGRSVKEVVPHLWPMLEPIYRRVLAGETVSNQEISGETASQPGARLHWLVSFYPVRLQHEVIGIGVTVNDITQRKQAEDALATRNNLYAMLSRTNRAVSRCHTSAELYQELCNIAVEIGRFRYAWVGVPDVKANRVKMVASAGDDGGYMNDLIITLDEDDPRSHGPTGRAAALGQSFVVNDFESSPMTQYWRAKAKDVGFAASATFPLKERGKVAAVLTLYAAVPGFFTDELVSTLSEITPNVSFALDRFVYEREQTEAAVALRQSESRFRELITALDVGVVLQDPEDRILVNNAAAASILGLTEDQLRGVTSRDPRWRLVKEDETTLPGDEVPSVVAARTLQPVRNAVLGSSNLQTGERTWLQVNALPQLNPDGSLRHVLVTLVDLTERRKAEESLHMRDRAIQAVSQGIVITDPRRPDNPIIYTSPGFERLTGYPAEEVLGRNCRFLQGKNTDPGAVMHLRDSLREGRGCTVELLNYRKDGSTFWNSLTISPVFDAHGQITNFVGVQTDVTERRRLEEQFRQAQKMEAIGQLAGGVAHDFNNLLTVINGYSDMLLEQLAVEDPLHNIVAEIHKAGDRAATLTRQLLTVSRQQVLEPKIINLNAILADTERMLQRLIGEHVVLETRLSSAQETIKADPGQIEQILINLAVNARDAMPHGGQLTISTSSVMLDKVYCRQHHELQAGSYVLLEVRDTGIGMDEATRSRIFEPFFTTKAVGKGTGLGLPTVHGIVKQSRGHIVVDTAPGQGTTFRVYFPRVQPSESLSDPGRRQGEMPAGSETVLLAEDEISVRALGSHILRTCGYKVLEAMNGKVALQMARDYQGAIDLLVTDVVMPHLGGRELAEELLRERPLCKVLFLSGYVDDAILRHGVEDAAYAFLQKPFAPQTLAQKVRNVLDAKT